MPDLRKQALEDFRRCCKEHGFAFTFQRQVIYEAVVDSRDHPTPDLIYEQVRKRIPSISLGTVYKNVKTFLDSARVSAELSSGGRELSLPDIGEKARTLTALIECKRYALLLLDVPEDRHRRFEVARHVLAHRRRYDPLAGEDVCRTLRYP